jgi:hypothetical protein
VSKCHTFFTPSTTMAVFFARSSVRIHSMLLKKLNCKFDGFLPPFYENPPVFQL